MARAWTLGGSRRWIASTDVGFVRDRMSRSGDRLCPPCRRADGEGFRGELLKQSHPVGELHAPERERAEYGRQRTDLLAGSGHTGRRRGGHPPHRVRYAGGRGGFL